MGSKDDARKKFRLKVPTSIAVMPIRTKLTIISSTIFFCSILFVASLHDFGLGEFDFWMFEYNDFNFDFQTNRNHKFEIDSVLEINEDDWVSSLEKESGPEELFRFRKASILSRILDEDISSAEMLYNNSSPQGKAFNYIVEQDKRQLHPDEHLLLQRYALAVLFFATQGDEWTYGNLHFLTGVQECYWRKKVHMTLLGVSACDSKSHVTHIQLCKYNTAADWKLFFNGICGK